jgi:predicted GNAT family acetyltransferase
MILSERPAGMLQFPPNEFNLRFSSLVFPNGGNSEKVSQLEILRWSPASVPGINALEKRTWAPWLRKPEDKIRSIAKDQNKRRTHLVAIDPSSRDIVGIISATRTNWDGDPKSVLPWDTYAGGSVATGDYPNYDNTGNTLVIMSSSVDPDHQGQGIVRSLFTQLQIEAKALGVKHIIGAFRPSEYGTYTRNSNNPPLSFEEYCERVIRGELHDHWLKAAMHMGMEPIRDEGRLRVEDSSMRVEVPLSDLHEFRAAYRPHKDASHPKGDWIEVDGKWYSGETGSWTIKTKEGTDELYAEYVEPNLLGEIRMS